MVSINNLSTAYVALRNLQNVNKEISATQNRISTGLRINSAADDPAAFAISQSLRSDIKNLIAINQNIDSNKGAIATVEI
jgi:flagellin